MTTKVQQFNPHDLTRAQNEISLPRWNELKRTFEIMTIDELRAANSYWFLQSMTFELTAPAIWVINTELTKRGVAPRWRGVPRFVKKALLSIPSPISKGPPRLGDVGTKNLMKRWVDLEWLRIELGPSHVPRLKIWTNVFAADLDQAISIFKKVNVVWAHGGGKVGTKPAYKVVHGLNLPKVVRFGLTGLIDRDSGERVRNMEKKVAQRIHPSMDALMTRDVSPLTLDEVKRRLLYCEAIELAFGRPTDAAKIFLWMTGETVSRQTMHEMRKKIAEQCQLTSRAWKPIKKKRSYHPLPSVKGGVFSSHN